MSNQRLGLTLAGLVVPILAGCFPVVLPAPSAKDPVPYTELDLASVLPLTTTRGELISRVGEPLLQRRQGELAIYGTVQKTGVQGLLFLVPAPIPISGDAREVVRHLFVNFDDQGLVESFEVVRGEGCTNDNICIEHSTTSNGAAGDGWHTGDKRMSPEWAVVYDRGFAAVTARTSMATASECLLFVFQEPGLFSGLATWFKLDDYDGVPLSPKAFALLHITRGSHRISAGSTIGHKTALLSVDCPGSKSLYVEIAAKIPNLFEKDFSARVKFVDAKTGIEEIADRGLLLVD